MVCIVPMERQEDVWNCQCSVVFFVWDMFGFGVRKRIFRVVARNVGDGHRPDRTIAKSGGGKIPSSLKLVHFSLKYYIKP
jgi:hypothetical protein